MGITRATTTDGIKLTFSLATDRPVSVVGDFNAWDPAAHPLKPRTNGKRSVVVTLPPGSRHAFRYLAEGGHFFDDPDADGYEANGYGDVHGVLVVDAPPAKVRKPAPRKPSATPAAAAAAPAPAVPAPAATPKKPTRPTAAAPKAAAKPSTARAKKKA